MKTTYLSNAFSLQMIQPLVSASGAQYWGNTCSGFGQTEWNICPINANEIPKTVTSAIGHADTAAILSDILGFPIPMNRINVTLHPGHTLYVAQYVGGRLPEGSKTLPEGSRFEYWKVDWLAY